MPTRERGRPARTFARHSLGRLRRWDGTATGPCLSFELANAVHAGRVAACRQPCAVAPPPPARNKVAGETPAFPGVILEVCKRPLARHSVGRLRRWDGTVAGPCLSFELASAVHAGRMAACRLPCAVAPPPPARNKVAGETPAFPGVILEVCKRPLARHSVGRLRRWDGTVAGPCLSFELASAVHAGRMAACRQPCAVAPSPPARNKVAGGTPAFPGGAQPALPGGGGNAAPREWVFLYVPHPNARSRNQ